MSSRRSIVPAAVLLGILFAPPSLPLEIFTFLGGTDRDSAHSLALASDGSVYVAGLTASVDFPVASGAFQTTHAGGANDLFVVRLAPDLGEVLAYTFIGGSGHEGDVFPDGPTIELDNLGPKIALDSKDRVLLAGGTASDDFPTTPGAWDSTHSGYWEDAFLLRLSPDLTTLVASTLFGGGHRDIARTVLAEDRGAVVVSGDTRSTDFPVTGEAYDSEYNGGYRDVFLLRFDAKLETLLASTFFGGEDDDFARACVFGEQGDIYVTGWTSSMGLPATPGAYDESHNGGSRDVYVARFRADLTALLGCTYLGGHDWGEPFHGGEHEGGCDEGGGLAFEEDGSLVIVGATHSADFPIVPGAFDPEFNNGETQQYDGFAAVMTPDLATLLHSTYLGGRGADDIYWVLPRHGTLLLAGGTNSPDLPVTPDARDLTPRGGMDGLLVRMSDDLGTVIYASYLGGSGDDQAYGLALQAGGDAVLAGYSTSADFHSPATGGFDRLYGGAMDAFALTTGVGGETAGTVNATIRCIPAAGTLPFLSQICVVMANPSGGLRLFEERIDVETAEGQFFSDYRHGWRYLSGGEIFSFWWSQYLPPYESFAGSNAFFLTATDVTPAPWNEPPYAPAGDTLTDECRIAGGLP